MSDARKTPLLRTEDVRKSYATPVLKGIDLDVHAGEVHALIGANGAGKTTLAKIVSGLTPLDQGAMWLGDKPYLPSSKADAENQGVHIVQQELNLIGTLSVAENLFLNRMPSRWGWISMATMCLEASAALESVGLEDVDPEMKVEELGVGKQQLVEIAAALSRRCRVLILDEPTAALTDPQVELLFEHIARLKTAGVGMIYISHRLDELREIADRATILRDGVVVTSRPLVALTMEEIVRQMVGQDVQEESLQVDREPGSVGLRVDGLCRGDLVRDVTFEARRGEIFGIAGLVGSGRTELLRAIFGADRAESGGVALEDSDIPRRFDSPRDAVRAGLALVPEDRKQHGLLLTQSVRVNLTLGKVREMTSLPWWIDAGGETREARSASELMHVHFNGLEQEVVELSGGNQQKVVIGRWVVGSSDVFLFDEPTRGIDVGAKAVVYHLLNDLAKAEKCIVVVSSDLAELFVVCDRIGVMSAGRLVEIFDRDNWSEEKIMRASFSGYVE